MSNRIFKKLQRFFFQKSHTYELGRWNSHINKRENWEYFLDMANYDNCCCSKDYSKVKIKKNTNKNYPK